MDLHENSLIMEFQETEAFLAEPTDFNPEYGTGAIIPLFVQSVYPSLSQHQTREILSVILHA